MPAPSPGPGAPSPPDGAPASICPSHSSQAHMLSTSGQAPGQQGQGISNCTHQTAGEVEAVAQLLDTPMTGVGGRCSPQQANCTQGARSPSPDAMQTSCPSSPQRPDDQHQQPDADMQQGPAAKATHAAGGPAQQPTAERVQQPDAKAGGGKTAGHVQVMGWPAHDLVSSMFGIQPQAVHVSDVGALTAQAITQLQRASEVVGSDPIAAHSMLTQAAAAAAVAAAAAAMCANSSNTGGAPASLPQPLPMPQPWTQPWIPGPGSNQAPVPGLFAPGLLGLLGPHSMAPHPGTASLPPTAPAGAYPGTNSQQPVNFGMFGLPGGLGPMAPWPMPPWPLPGGLPMPLPPPWQGALGTGQGHGLPDNSALLPPGKSAGGAVVGSAPASCPPPWPPWPGPQPPIAEAAAPEKHATAGHRAVAANGTHHNRRRASLGAGALSLDQVQAGLTTAATLAVGHTNGSGHGVHPTRHQRSAIHHSSTHDSGSVAVETTVAAVSLPGAQRTGSSRTYRFVVQAANSTWRAQVGHSENGQARKLYGPPHRTAERAARDADQLLFKLRGPSFPLNLGLTAQQTAHISKLSLEELLEELHANKDKEERHTGLRGAVQMPPCPSPLGTSAMDAASALVFMSQDHKAEMPWPEIPLGHTPEDHPQIVSFPPGPGAGNESEEKAGSGGAGNGWLESMSGPFSSEGGGTGEEEEVKKVGNGGPARATPSSELSDGADDMVCSDEGHDAPDECSPAGALDLPAWRHAGVAPKEGRRKRGSNSLPTPGVAEPAALPTLHGLSGTQAELPAVVTSAQGSGEGAGAMQSSSSMECNTSAPIPSLAVYPAPAADPAPATQEAALQHSRYPAHGGHTASTNKVPAPGTSLLSQHLQRPNAHLPPVPAEPPGGMQQPSLPPMWPGLMTLGSCGLPGAQPSPWSAPPMQLPGMPGPWHHSTPLQVPGPGSGHSLPGMQLHSPGHTVAAGSPADSHHHVGHKRGGSKGESKVGTVYGSPVDLGSAGSKDLGGGVQGSGKTSGAHGERPPYRYIVKIGSRWRAQVGQVDGGVQRKYYGPYLDDPASAARDADMILYKLRGASAVTNLPLSAETKAHLDSMSLAQLLQSFKNVGGNTHRASGDHDSTGSAAAGVPTKRGVSAATKDVQQAGTNGQVDAIASSTGTHDFTGLLLPSAQGGQSAWTPSS